jgi:hypothetical protein
MVCDDEGEHGKREDIAGPALAILGPETISDMTSPRTPSETRGVAYARIYALIRTSL